MLRHAIPRTKAIPTLGLALTLVLAAGLSLVHAPAASAQCCDTTQTFVSGIPNNADQPVIALASAPVSVVSSYVASPIVSSYVAPPVVSAAVAPPVTTYFTNTVIAPPTINGIPYVVAGADSWVSPGGSYCNLPAGGQAFVPNGASPAAYGC